MKLISEHIQLLLYRNDCVVVPGLGGFILNHFPAGYNEKEEKYYPPRALPLFNKQLQSNDGLLASALVKKKGMEYSEALTEIKRFTEQVNETLADNRQYVLQGMGTFSRNSEGQTIFEPDPNCNLYIGSYGLEPLEAKQVLKVADIGRKALAPVRKKSRAWMATAASLAILVAAGWWLNYSVQTPFGNQWSALNPLEWLSDNGEDVKIEVEPDVNNNPAIEPEMPSGEQNTQPALAEKPADVVKEAPIVFPVQTASDSLYLIVVGSFKNDQNAARREMELKNEGFSALSYRGSDSQLLRVCAEQHTKRFEAEERLPFIRQNTHPKAWILAIAKDPTN